MVLVSHPAPGGHHVVLVTDEGAEVAATFTDDGSERDITSFAADLAVIGLASLAEPHPAGLGPSGETVEVASVRVTGEVKAIYTHIPTAAGVEIPTEELLRFIAAGMARAVTAGILTESYEDAPDAISGPPEAIES